MQKHFAAILLIFALIFIPGCSAKQTVPPKPTSKQAVTRSDPAFSLQSSVPFVMPKPRFINAVEAPNDPGVRPLRLRRKGETANQITDVENWFESNNLFYPVYKRNSPKYGIGPFPKWIPKKYKNSILVKVILQENLNMFLIYGKDYSEGRYLISVSPIKNKPRYVLDFAAYAWAPKHIESEKRFAKQATQWAVEENGILYVSHFNLTYAKSSKGMNGYITAIDIKTRKLLWRSRPLVCNSNNFIIKDDTVITGYGFTQEPDYIYLLNKFTGMIMRRTKIKSRSEFLVPRGEELFVRTYNTDYVFEMVK